MGTSSISFLNNELSKKTSILGMKLWGNLCKRTHSFDILLFMSMVNFKEEIQENTKEICIYVNDTHGVQGDPRLIQ
jgi:hypothetical protein